MLGDTDNKRVVRILLECILVLRVFAIVAVVGIQLSQFIHRPPTKFREGIFFTAICLSVLRRGDQGVGTSHALLPPQTRLGRR